jgi:hypothetical protein
LQTVAVVLKQLVQNKKAPSNDSAFYLEIYLLSIHAGQEFFVAPGAAHAF